MHVPSARFPSSERMLAADDDLVQRVVARLHSQRGSRVQGFQMSARDDGLILRGEVSTAYSKQVVQHVVMEVSGLSILSNDIEVRRVHTPPPRLPGIHSVDKIANPLAQEIVDVINAFQMRTTGQTPKAVSVVLSEETLVITLHEALTPAERALAGSADGAAQVQEFHRQLFASSSEPLRQAIKRITGRQVRESIVEVEPATGAIVHAFTTGTIIQVFSLALETPFTN